MNQDLTYLKNQYNYIVWLIKQKENWLLVNEVNLFWWKKDLSRIKRLLDIEWKEDIL